MRAQAGLILAVMAVVAVGLVAGLLLGSGLSSYTSRELPEMSWVLRFQAEDRLFSRVMPPCFLTTLLLLAAVCLLSRGMTRGMFGVAGLLMLIAIVWTVRLEVPLNREIQSWTAGAAPATWAQVRDQWLRNHLVRTLLCGAAFLCAVGGLARS